MHRFEVVLIVKFRVDDLERDQIIWVVDNGISRPPGKRAIDVQSAHEWLDADGYKLSHKTWLDKAGKFRRQQLTYTKEVFL